MDDHNEPTGEAFAKAAQVMAMTASIGEALARLRAQRATERAEVAEREATAARVQQAIRHQNARLAWAPALTDHHLVRMAASEMLHALDTARPYEHLDPTAHLAVERIHRRLRDIHPEAMTAYNAAVRDGADPRAAMQRAVPLFCGEFGLDPAGTALHLQFADATSHQAGSARRADNPTTRVVDEATTGQRAAVQLTATSDAERAQALSALTFPVSIHDAMTTAPKAAKAMLALPAAPVRRQLTTTAAASQVTTPARR